MSTTSPIQKTSREQRKEREQDALKRSLVKSVQAELRRVQDAVHSQNQKLLEELQQVKDGIRDLAEQQNQLAANQEMLVAHIARMSTGIATRLAVPECIVNPAFYLGIGPGNVKIPDLPLDLSGGTKYRELAPNEQARVLNSVQAISKEAGAQAVHSDIKLLFCEPESASSFRLNLFSLPSPGHRWALYFLCLGLVRGEGRVRFLLKDILTKESLSALTATRDAGNGAEIDSGESSIDDAF